MKLSGISDKGFTRLAKVIQAGLVNRDEDQDFDSYSFENPLRLVDEDTGLGFMWKGKEYGGWVQVMYQYGEISGFTIEPTPQSVDEIKKAIEEEISSGFEYYMGLIGN